ATNTGPREVPVAVAGPPEAVEQVEAALGAAPGPDDVAAFEVTAVADEVAATLAIEERDVYGAVVVTPDGPRLLVASAAGPAVAQMLRAAAAELSEPGAAAPVTDVVPTTPDDPTGAGLAAGVLPVIITSAAGGLIAAVALRSTRLRLAAVTGITVLGGLVSAAVLQYGLGVVDGSYVEAAGVAALLIGAVAAGVAGLGAVLGRPGAVLGLLVMILVGNPLSAAASAPEMLPQPWGAVGQFLPPGAGVSALRSVAFFDGAAARTPILVLSIWLVAGLLLTAVAGTRRRAEPATPTSAPEVSAGV
ncbi:MAG: hypothetical protein ACRDVN_05625, partial [Jiangellaceae bacterium]